jgi:PPP family 3-phenylpropionic acid transporter
MPPSMNDDYNLESLPGGLSLGSSTQKRTASTQERTQRRVLKLLYFMQTGAAAGLVKFFPVFLAQRLGYSATQIGISTIIQSIANFAGGLFWGRFADITGRYKWTMILTNAVSVALAFLFDSPSLMTSFTVFLYINTVYAFFGSCWGTLVDAVAVIGAGASYGRLRLWAAVGWGSLAVVTGLLIDLTNIGIIFVTFGVGMLISTIIVVRFFDDPKRNQADVREYIRKSSNGTLDANVHRENQFTLTKIICSFEVMLLLLDLFIQGALQAFVEVYLYVYLDEVYHCPGYFLGICTLVAAIFELPVFYYSEKLIASFGCKGLLTFAQILYTIRVVAYMYIPNNSGALGYWLFLLTEPLHAFVFAAMWVAAVEYSRLLAPAEHQGSMQALVRGTYYFIGNGCGSLLGGYLIDVKGGGADGYHFMFWFGAITMMSWSLLWHALMCIDKTCKVMCTSKELNSKNTSFQEQESVHRRGEAAGVEPEATQPLRSSLASPLLSTDAKF